MPWVHAVTSVPEILVFPGRPHVSGKHGHEIAGSAERQRSSYFVLHITFQLLYSAIYFCEYGAPMTQPTLHDELGILVDHALAEDVGTGDVTTQYTIPADSRAVGKFTSRESGIIAGMEAVRRTFEHIDATLEVRADIQDGQEVEPGRPFAFISGSAQSMLTGERTALNFLRHLSGVATLTHRFVQAVRDTQARIVDTRKTTPGFRLLEKQAVRAGGGGNHRFGLYDMILIKDNHIAAAGGITTAVTLCRTRMSETDMNLKIEVETETMDQVEEAAKLGVDRIMLDNMAPDQMRNAVQRVRRLTGSDSRIEIEASGAITLDRVYDVAVTGVDLISIGALTHSVTALDISLEIS